MAEDNLSANNKLTLLPANATGKSGKDEAEAELTQTSSTNKIGMMGLCRNLCRKSPLTFTLAAALCFLTQICLVVFTPSQITFLEKEFGFSTSQTGRIVSASQIGSLCLVLPSGYLASRLHVPRVMTFVSVCFGVVCIMAGLPRFLFPVSSSGDSVQNSSTISAADIPPAFCWVGEEAEGKGEERCGAVMALRNGTSDVEVVYNQRAHPVYVFLILCMVIRGGMGATMFPMFAQYLETNAKKTDTGFYMGIAAGVAMLGPAIAFLGSGAVSKVHVSLKPTDLNPTHPDWVGAWWLGFLIFGSMAAVAPVFVCQFPRRLTPPLTPSTLPSSSPLLEESTTICTQQHEEDKEKGASEEEKEEEKEEKEEEESSSSCERKLGRGRLGQGGKSCFAVMGRGVLELKGFVLALMRLLLNPVYVFLVLSSCFLGFSINLYLFMPKYMQDQFQIPLWKANFIMGASELSMGTTGSMMGGWVTKRLKLTRARLYHLLLGITLMTLLTLVVMMLLGCTQATLIGAPEDQVGYNNCTRLCACPDEVLPVCDRESRDTYFSPCHAGCSGLREGVYVNCSCTASGQVYPGECISDCSTVYYFSAMFFGFILFISLGGPVNYLVLIRSLSPSQTGLGIGLYSFATGTVSFLIGPLVFGGLIDSFCDHWKTPCDVKGQCSVYDKERFRIEIHLYSIVPTGMCIICILISYLLYTCCPSLSTEDKDLENQVEKNGLEGELEQSSPELVSEDVRLVNHSHTTVPESCVPVEMNRGKGETVDDVLLSVQKIEEED